MRLRDYIFVLERNGIVIDDTSLDENNVNLAKQLFYGEFGHKKQKGDKVYLLKSGYNL